ncbi:replication initiation protein [Alteromonas antoniana]|uniref:replication initiation protein n=1 Tax=Alteromonas antoniana TaxID=2803813 RepID=UPI001C4831EE|nr:replication initiation protein [Alteromonas antoniana]
MKEDDSNNKNDTPHQMTLLQAEAYTKNVALAGTYGLSELSLRKQRAVNTIAHVVREQFFLRNPSIENSDDLVNSLTEEYIENTNTVFDVPEDQIMAAMGYKDRKKYHSYTQVLALFEEISNETIGFDALGIARSKAQREEWKGFTKFIGSVERVNGRFRISMPPKMVHKIVNPETSFQGRVDWRLYSSRNTPSIYETCEIFWQQGETKTDWYSVEDIRRLTGTLSFQTYENPAKLKNKIIDVALNDINNNQELPLHVEVEQDCQGPTLDAWLKKQKETNGRAGRKTTTHFRFTFREKALSITKNESIHNEIKITSFKMELRSLGVASNQIEGVLNECRDEDGTLNLRYLGWCIRKGRGLRELAKYKETDINQFGGLFRKQVIRGQKEFWFSVDSLLVNYLSERISDFDPKHEKHGRELSRLYDRLKTSIVTEFLNTISESAFAHVRSDFIDFLEANFPDKFKRYQEGSYAQSLQSLCAVGMESYPFHLYLELNCDLFTTNQFKFALFAESEKD